MAYITDNDWTDEAEAEQAAVRTRGGAPSIGVPIVTAALGLLVGVLGTSLWWTWAGPSRESAVTPANVPSAASAPKVVVATPPAAVVVPPSPVVAAAPRDNDDAVLVKPAAAAASVTAPALSPEEVARRKERAFARFYKRPPGCEGNPTGEQLVECGNHYIRMRREFDERWRVGSL